ncbi:MAG: ABC transporter ATP-binding protein [archaeon]|nr:ABC transporter ATP-binding protein [archaeon]
MELEINDLRFSYGSKETLKGLTFNARPGEVLGILGENGCGKTTLLKCINSLLKPSDGRIEILDFDQSVFSEKTLEKVQDGRLNVRDVSTKDLAKTMAVVSQSAIISFPFTVLEAVMMGAYSKPNEVRNAPKEKKDHVFNCLRDAGALELVHRNVNELSGGELRRVMIARALVQNPTTLLLDEPTLHLDVIHQIELMELVTELASKHNILVIMVTHDMMLAARYCDKIILMEKGRIVETGPTEQVMTEKNLDEVFHVRCRVQKDEEIKGLNVTIVGRSKNYRGFGSE